MTGHKVASIRMHALVAACGAALSACGGEETVPIQGAMACGSILSGNGESRQCYAADSVAAGESCTGTTQTRICHNGAWDPDFDACAHLSCFVQNGGDCGGTANGATESRPCYAADSVPTGQTCTATTQYRTCVAGAWSPDYPTCDHLSCFVQGHASCGSTPSGNSETRPCYAADVVAAGETCNSTTQTRICVDGAWSPDYPVCTHLTCTASQSGTFLRVNIGGPDYTGAEVWSADAPAGVTISTSNTTTPGGPYSQNTTDEQALLTTGRWWDISGGQSATATVSGLENGTYTVRFLVCESVWSTVGARVFGFEAEGLRLDSSIDPYALASSQNDLGVWQEYTGIVVADGQLNLAWPAVVDNPELRAIEIAGPGFAGCVPQCGGKECGDDACGGNCGPCGGGDTCNVAGQCVPVGGTTAPSWDFTTYPDVVLPGFPRSIYVSSDVAFLDFGLAANAPDPNGYSVQILRDGDSTGMPAASGVASFSYTFTGADTGHIIAFILTNTNAGGTSEPVTAAGVIAE